jgi:hypothetical protein
MSSETTPSPAVLWKQMSEAQKLQAAEAFWREPDSGDQQIEAMVLLAQKLKARPKFVASLPPERKARHLAHFPGMPDVLAARLLVSYHLAHQRPMMAAFLDALGVAHEDGLINDELETAVAPEMLAKGVDALRAAYAEADVRLYFETLLLQDPDTWGGLSTHLHHDKPGNP